MAEVNATLAVVLARIASLPGLKGTDYAPGGLVSTDQSDALPMPKPAPRSPYILASVPVLRDPWRDVIRIGSALPWPDRSPAPWRIWRVNREWRIEKRVGDKYETWCRFDTSAQAYAAFAAGAK